MKNSFNFLIKNLPAELKKEIFYYIIPYSKNIKFKRNNRKNIIQKRNQEIPSSFYSKINISDKYEVALLDESIEYYEDGLINPNILYLFRIPKKNGKHRYYITEMIWYELEVEDSDYNIIYISENKYISKYVGKNLDYALLLLLTQENILEEEINNYLLKIR